MGALGLLVEVLRRAHQVVRITHHSAAPITAVDRTRAVDELSVANGGMPRPIGVGFGDQRPGIGCQVEDRVAVAAPALLVERDTEPGGTGAAVDRMNADRLSAHRGWPVGIALDHAVDGLGRDVDELAARWVRRIDAEDLRVRVLVARACGRADPVVETHHDGIARDRLTRRRAGQIDGRRGRLVIADEGAAVEEIDRVGIHCRPFPEIVDRELMRHGMRGAVADGQRVRVELEPIALSLWALQLDGGRVAVPGSVETGVGRDERLAAGRVLVGHAQDSGAKRRIIDDRVRWTERGGGRSRFRVDSAVGGVRRRRHCLGKCHFGKKAHDYERQC